MSEETVLSVGIDLGTSTTQMIISKLYIQNMASAFTIPRITITDKQVVFKSEIIFTPILANNLIDVEAIKLFVGQQYQQAGIDKEEIQIGAVIITGETARKENSSNVLQALSGFAGDFVVATAGPDLESIIAGRGAGAQRYSKEHHTSVVNLDIGGGTTNLALFYDDEVFDTGCLDIGGRLIRVDPQTQKITYIAPKIAEIIKDESLSITVGQLATVAQLMPIVTFMVTLLENSVGIGVESPYYRQIITNKGIESKRDIKAISFSGGVADCLVEKLPNDPFRYGDIGLLLGTAIAHSRLVKEIPVIKSLETIRATVVGAGSHTAEISGSTITYREEVLPIKNLPVLKLTPQDEKGDRQELAVAILKKLQWYQLENDFQGVALAIEGEKNPTFQRVLDYAGGIVEGLAAMINHNEPLVISVQQDMAKSLGQCLHSLLPTGYPFVCIDSVRMENGDYIDIGKPVAGGSVLPVVVKTLIFN
ncbi:ethanolamine ammonia-lyase reactivating factor EutA [Vagococcus sp. BWB3-3]|uniref:Ethanolamine ammonia-lyase reactivating factor EutA n=1 Tax=Vagococcus allomyrinae TaxID=2794353 RepID=A0A940P4F0_9ENTE|nr:ethanolamine ammonia-lyase reactivating factor EutA [Vagococcus allomyrinae]MBP1040835.1 ethanolamine ammonia-lyase reactivating factor EutA [Vagococcus allomyrinae]